MSLDYVLKKGYNVRTELMELCLHIVNANLNFHFTPLPRSVFMKHKIFFMHNSYVCLLSLFVPQ
jgi:hypothetical protein